MQFLLLICLMIVCAPIQWPASSFGLDVEESALATGCMVLLLLAGSALIARRARFELIEHPSSRDEVAARYAAARTYFFFANLGGYAAVLLLLGWGWAAQRIGLVEYDDRLIFIPGGELLILAPFLLSQIGSWCFFFHADREFHRLLDPAQRGKFWSLGGYVLFLFRQQFVLLFAPLVLMVGQQGLERLYPELFRAEWLPYASPLIIPIFLVFFPLLLPALLGLRPMPAGPVRDRLEANARRLHFRYRRIYLWDTRGGVANAMIVGVIPAIRYVVFTDRLLDELSEDEIDAVFGHEVGHARHGHMLYYGLFLILSFVLMSAVIHAVEPFDEGTRESRALVQVVPIAAMGLYMFAAFGFISRRCERQADIFGCKAGSCDLPSCSGHRHSTVYPEGGATLCPTGVGSFVRALRRVEEINGLAREMPKWRGAGARGKLHWIFRLLTGWLHTWQHSTISRRIAFLEQIARDPRVERRFQSNVWVLKWLIALGLFGTLVGLGLWRQDLPIWHE